MMRPMSLTVRDVDSRFDRLLVWPTTPTSSTLSSSGKEESNAQDARSFAYLPPAEVWSKFILCGNFWQI